MSAAPPRSGSLISLYHRAIWWRHDAKLLGELHGIKTVVAFGASLGDNLLCTRVLAKLHEAGAGPLAMLTYFPDLFEGLPFPVRILPYSDALVATLSRRGPKLLRPEYGKYVAELDRHIPPPRGHMLTEMCRSIGLEGSVELKTLWRATAGEISAAAPLATGAVLIQSSAGGAVTPSANKEWPFNRWQQVADRLAPRFPLVQIGDFQDPLLAGVTDYRGRLSRRETAAALATARLFVGPEGFPMHLARAVNTRGVIVLGGRTLPEQTCYSENGNLYRPVTCSPCWQRNTCQFDRMCLTQISADDVIEAVHAQLSLPPLGAGQRVQI